MNTSKLLVYAFVTILLMGCKTQKNTTLIPLEQLQQTYHSLTMKAKLSFDSDDKSNKANLDIKVRKDSALWVSVKSTVGGEGFRILVRPDSIYMLDRLGKKCYFAAIESIEEQLGVAVSFEVLQAVLIGQLPFDQKNRPEKIAQSEKNISYQQKNPHYTLSAVLELLSKTVSQIEINQNNAQNRLFIQYDDVQAVEQFNMPHLLLAKYFTAGQQKPAYTLELTFSKVTLENQGIDLPFIIPEKYEKIDGLTLK